MKNKQFTRREYGNKALLEENISTDPFLQFQIWFSDAIEVKSLDPSAMVLATVDENGIPDSRVVLLKGFDQHGFIFFSHYNSPKARQAEKSGFVALNFYWPELARQVRIKGKIERISRQDSEVYFASRPRESQIGTLASKQSALLSSRDELENRITEITISYQSKEIPCPESWGGFCVKPFEFEFFQGRDNRINDRIHYIKKNDQWKIERLFP